MIPYEDLVVALANWRAKQGLGSPAPAPVATQSAAPVAPAAKTPSGPKTAPPTAAPKKAEPAVLVSEPAIEVDEHETLLETEDEELNSTFDGLTMDSEATSIGGAPQQRDSFAGATVPERGPMNPKGSIRPPGNRNDDW